MVSLLPRSFYTLGSKDINRKWASNETDKIFYVKNNVSIGTTDGAKNASAAAGQNLHDGVVLAVVVLVVGLDLWLKALGEHDAVASTYGDQTKIIPGHSTLVTPN